MPTVKSAAAFLALLAALLLLMPTVPAEEPEEAPALWTELYGDDGVVGLRLGEGGVAEGEPIQGALTFRDGYGVEDVRYQICRIGESCFAIGVPTHNESGTWTFDTADIPAAIGRSAPTTYEAGQRIGVQFFVCTAADPPCPENPLEWRFFPVGEEGCVEKETTEAFRACEETHYFGVTIEESRRTPGPGLLGLVAGLAAVALLARRR